MQTSEVRSKKKGKQNSRKAYRWVLTKRPRSVSRSIPIFPALAAARLHLRRCFHNLHTRQRTYSGSSSKLDFLADAESTHRASNR
jgi:hypothetical protein